MTHFSSDYQISRSGSEHSSERPCEMCGIGETRDIGGLSGRCSMHEFIRSPLKSKPKNIRAERYTDGLGKDVHETRPRKTRDSRQSLQRNVRSLAKVVAKIFENATDLRVNLHGLAPIQEFLANPVFDA
jgi:hypothetical protein